MIHGPCDGFTGEPESIVMPTLGCTVLVGHDEPRGVGIVVRDRNREWLLVLNVHVAEEVWLAPLLAPGVVKGTLDVAGAVPASP